ncbi:NRDE family protein [Halomonas sp. 328]|uniref:NRDE family protein n=1 Tax=Halomonas sp. 328 TaxID=2776704 RepID=UPI0018A7B2C9|nr:NRDE family protein [Halomonas sp. 328]MBF8221368.1 NRDE family protein [Halomonas sp. 328]
MCLIALAHHPDAPHWLHLVANRDEFHDRPSAPLADWPDAPQVIGGRDLRAGGSWLALHRRGRLATVTNVRDPALVVPQRAPSRGELVHQALTCDDPEAWLGRLAAGEAWRYAGFNLLVAEGRRLWHLHRSRHALTLRRVTPGLHGLSNADLDTPWPKLLATRQGLAESLDAGTWPDGALAAMGTPREYDDARLPDTGVGRELERRLSAAFIRGETYGTRATTWLRWHRDGGMEIAERRFGPGGRAEGESRRDLQLAT